MREIAGVFACSGVVPLLAQLGDLRRLTRDDACAGRVPLEDAVLQDLSDTTEVVRLVCDWK